MTPQRRYITHPKGKERIMNNDQQRNEERDPRQDPQVGDCWHEAWSVWYVVTGVKNRDLFHTHNTYGGGLNDTETRDQIRNAVDSCNMLYFGNLVTMNEEYKAPEDGCTVVDGELKYHQHLLYRRFFED